MRPPSLQDNAAYSASQPLYDALRVASVRVEEQRELLASAKEQVQKLHVKLHNEQTNGFSAQREGYVECTIKAWRSATDAFTEIFKELANITAADASEGRAEKQDHELFKTVANTAEMAKSAAFGFHIPSDLSTGATGATESGRESTKDAGKSSLGKRSARTSIGTAASPQHPAKISRTTNREDKSEGTADVLPRPTGRLPSRNTHPVDHKKKRGPAALQGQATLPLGSDRPLSQPNTQNSAIPVSGAAQAQSATFPRPLYEDVTREVEARLKAKEEKRKETKGDKKRKRQSGESFASVEGVRDPGQGSKPKQEPAKNVVQRSAHLPSKKNKIETAADSEQYGYVSTNNFQSSAKRKSVDGKALQSNHKKRRRASR